MMPSPTAIHACDDGTPGVKHSSVRARANESEAEPGWEVLNALMLVAAAHRIIVL
jgi:hypothetical protein